MPLLTLALVWFAVSLIVGLLGIHRKIGFWGYFFFSLIFSPIMGLILLIVSAESLVSAERQPR